MEPFIITILCMQLLKFQMGKLTCRSAMNKKKTLEYRLNCSRRNLGRNVKKLYLAVLQGSKLISHKFK